MRRIALLVLTLLAYSPLVSAQEEVKEKPDQKVRELLPFQKAFTNLPEEKRKQFIKHRAEANRLFQEKRIIESLEAIRQAQIIFTDAPEVLNLKGSCYVQIRAFDKALISFKKALELTPDNAGLHFNIAEMYFVKHDWENAHQAFEDLVKSLPAKQPQLLRLSEFKLMLSKIKLNRMKEAQELADKYDYLDDSPFHYYAKAALAFEDDELMEAQKWMARAARIFRNAEILLPWHDTMAEFGYIGDLHSDKDQ